MEQYDKDTINTSLVQLTKGESSLDLGEQFLSLLKQYRIFSEEMINDILKNENPKLELCLMLTRRGPHAFANFVRCLAETQQGRVLAALAETRANLNLAPLAVPAAAVPAVPAAVVPAAVAPAASPPIEILGTPAAGHSPYELRRTPMSSPNSPLSADYRRKVLDPANYGEAPRSPLSPAPWPVTDAAPPDYTILDVQVAPAEVMRGTGPEGYPNRCLHPRGMALIINYETFVNAEPRVGSEKDVIHLDQLLCQLGYVVTLRTNLTMVETYKELEAFTQNEDHQEADSTVVAIMSHGKGGTQSEGTLVYTRDGRFIPSNEVLERFNNKSCPLLKGKPKIFLFQFCRGDNVDQALRSVASAPAAFYGRTVTDGQPVQPASPILYERSNEDMLIAYSTLPGYVSYREESEGTWFIKALCLVFMKEACVYHVDRLLQRVDSLVACWRGQHNGMQTLEIIRRGFNRKFYFNPGLWRSAHSSSSNNNNHHHHP